MAADANAFSTFIARRCLASSLNSKHGIHQTDPVVALACDREVLRDVVLPLVWSQCELSAASSSQRESLNVARGDATHLLLSYSDFTAGLMALVAHSEAMIRGILREGSLVLGQGVQYVQMLAELQFTAGFAVSSLWPRESSLLQFSKSGVWMPTKASEHWLSSFEVASDAYTRLRDMSAGDTSLDFEHSIFHILAFALGTRHTSQFGVKLHASEDKVAGKACFTCGSSVDSDSCCRKCSFVNCCGEQCLRSHEHVMVCNVVRQNEAFVKSLKGCATADIYLYQNNEVRACELLENSVRRGHGFLAWERLAQGYFLQGKIADAIGSARIATERSHSLLGTLILIEGLHMHGQLRDALQVCIDFGPAQATDNPVRMWQQRLEHESIEGPREVTRSTSRLMDPVEEAIRRLYDLIPSVDEEATIAAPELDIPDVGVHDDSGSARPTSIDLEDRGDGQAGDFDTPRLPDELLRTFHDGMSTEGKQIFDDFQHLVTQLPVECARKKQGEDNDALGVKNQLKAMEIDLLMTGFKEVERKSCHRDIDTKISRENFEDSDDYEECLERVADMGVLEKHRDIGCSSNPYMMTTFYNIEYLFAAEVRSLGERVGQRSEVLRLLGSSCHATQLVALRIVESYYLERDSPRCRDFAFDDDLVGVWLTIVARQIRHFERNQMWSKCLDRPLNALVKARTELNGSKATELGFTEGVLDAILLMLEDKEFSEVVAAQLALLLLMGCRTQSNRALITNRQTDIIICLRQYFIRPQCTLIFPTAAAILITLGKGSVPTVPTSGTHVSSMVGTWYYGKTSSYNITEDSAGALHFSEHGKSAFLKSVGDWFEVEMEYGVDELRLDTCLDALRPQHFAPGVWLTAGVSALGKRIGRLYHEVCLGPGFSKPRIGWLTSNFKAGPFDGNGVGDDSHGWAAGSKIWHNGGGEALQWPQPWEVGDVVGCAIDFGDGVMKFSLNGQWIEAASVVFDPSALGQDITFYPAVSIIGNFAMHLPSRTWKYEAPDGSYEAWATSGKFERPRPKPKKLRMRRIGDAMLSNCMYAGCAEWSCDVIANQVHARVEVTQAMRKWKQGFDDNFMRLMNSCSHMVHNGIQLALDAYKYIVQEEFIPSSNRGKKALAEFRARQQRDDSTGGRNPLGNDLLAQMLELRKRMWTSCSDVDSSFVVMSTVHPLRMAAAQHYQTKLKCQAFPKCSEDSCLNFEGVMHLQKCACRKVQYCSTKCQKKDWKLRHKSACKSSLSKTQTVGTDNKKASERKSGRRSGR